MFGRPRSFLNNRFVYLVLSQRAGGLSIGVNLNPDKRCNFKCVYCEVDRSTPGRDTEIDLAVLSEELENLLREVAQHKLAGLPEFGRLPSELLELKEVALSGDGEPTLCPQFKDVVSEVACLRARGPLPDFKIVLITNTAGLTLQPVQETLRWFTGRDEIWVKLDAGTQEYMDRVNGPGLKLSDVLGNILSLGLIRPVIIQSLFPLIKGQEPDTEEIEKYAHRLQELKAAGAQIDLVQIYSAHRPPHSPDCGHLPLKRLYYIARRVRAVTGLKTEVF